MSAEHPTLTVPAGLQTRIRRFVMRRLLLSVLTGLFWVVGLTAGIVVVGVVLEHLVMLGPTARLLWLWACCLPAVAGLVGLLWVLRHNHATEADLRRLDNQADDMRATLNLADRLARGEAGIDPQLASQSAARSQQVAAAPLPPMPAETARLKRALVCTVIGLVALAATRALAPDLHTVVRRATDRQADYGTVGRDKFPLWAGVQPNPATAPDLWTDGDGTDSEPVAVQAVAFQDMALVDGELRVGSAPPPRYLADRLAGYTPYALNRRELDVLAGDRLSLTFTAVRDGDPAADADLELLRLDGDREIPLQFTPDGDLAGLTIPRLEETQRLLLRRGDAQSPVYQVTARPRPSPTRIVLFQSPPAHYGRPTTETVVRDRAVGIDGSRLAGLPGARMAIEFETAYGADLDTAQSYATLAGRRLPLRYLSSRNPERRARGEKVWTTDFTLDESIAADPKLYLRLVTRDATHDGQPIDNRYDDPLLVHMEDDQPPTIEITQLPGQTHFEKDAALAFRYRYTDDYGIAELGLELQPSPTNPTKSYIPLPIRPTDQPGQARQTDELLHIIDLASIRGNYLAFAVIVRDLKGQEARSSTVSVTMSRHFTEELLPKLTGGWFWAPSHQPNRPQKRPGDLESPPHAAAFAGYQAGLRATLSLLDTPDANVNARQLAKQLQFPFATYLDMQDFSAQPFAFHHRDYPYYFRRQASRYLTGLARLGQGEELQVDQLAPLLQTVAGADDRQAAPEWQALQAMRPAIEAELARVQQLDDLHDEVALRAALLRAAHLCQVIDDSLDEARGEFARLQAASPTAPAVSEQEDPWRVTIAWARDEHPDFDRRQQAQLVALQVRNLNRRLARLNSDLAVIASIGGEDLDPRLRAAVGMVRRFGESVFGIDREALQARMRLLSRFIRQGILASETAVYSQIDEIYQANAELAAAAAQQVEPAARFNADLTALLDAARQLSYAQLHRKIGDGDFPAGASLKLQRNQESQIRSELELLNRQASGLLFAEPFLSCQDLVATIREAADVLQTLDRVEAWLPTWPRLAERRAVLDETRRALTAYQSSARELLQLQRRIGTLADFAPMFDSDDSPAELRAALTALSEHGDLAVEARRQIVAREKLQEQRRAKAGNDKAVAELDAKLAEQTAAHEARYAAIRTHLTLLAQAFRQPLPAADTDATRRPMTAPANPLIAGTTPAVFDAQSPVAMLDDLLADLGTIQDPARREARLAAAVSYFEHYPSDAGIDALANPLADYLQARIATALIACDPQRMGDFARTYTESGDHQRPAILAHLKPPKDELNPAMVAWVEAQAYPVPAVPDAWSELAAPYLQAARDKTLPAYLDAQRQARLRELKALRDQLAPHLAAYELRLRTRALQTAIDGLLEDLLLYHLQPDDIRAVERWARIAEQVEGLDRDLRAGRLALVPAAEHQALYDALPVFRRRDLAGLALDPDALGRLRAYRDAAGRIAAAQAAAVARGTELALADRAAYSRDLSLALMASLHTQTLYRRKLQAELELRSRELAGLSQVERAKRRSGLGPSDDARALQKTANLASFAWRSLLVLAADHYVRSQPSDETRAQFYDDLVSMLAYKALPEHYYDGFTGRIARLRYAAFTTTEALASQMIENLDKGQTAMAILTARQLGTAPDLPITRDPELQATLNDLGVITIAFQLEKELNRFDELLDATATQIPPESAARIRKLHAAQGAFWREFAERLIPYLEAGDQLLALPPGADAIAAARPLIATQRRTLDDALAYLDRYGSGLSETEQAELAPVIEAQLYALRWEESLGDPAAAADLLAGYSDVHATVVSYIKSIHGAMYPEQPDYQARTRYKHAMHHFMNYDFEAEILDMEFTWFRRADEQLARVYRTLLLRHETRPAEPRDLAWAWSRYIDTKFRYLMAYSSPEPGGVPPPAALRITDETLPQHLGQAFSNALNIDLPNQDNPMARQLYFEALRESREKSEGAAQ